MARRDSWWLLGAGALVLWGATAQARRKGISLAAIRSFAVGAGFPDPDLAAAIAMAESGGVTNIVAKEPIGSASYGLWQIHWSDHREYDPMSLLDPAYNARAAFDISRNGSDFSQWTTFRTGDYKRYLPGAV